VLLLTAESLLLGGGGAALGVKISQTEEGSDDTHTHWLLSLAFNALGNECTHTRSISRARDLALLVRLLFIFWFRRTSCRGLVRWPLLLVAFSLFHGPCCSGRWSNELSLLSSSSSLCNQNTHRTPLIIIYTCAQRQSRRGICGHACSDERAPVRCFV
jgi:hypothetical protein